MTTTRINHTGHDHPNTTVARTKCRKEMSSVFAAIARIDAHAADPSTFTWDDNDGCMAHRDNPERCDKVGAYRVAGDVWCATAMDEHRIIMAGCRRCGNKIFGMDVTAPNAYGACGPTYCHYAVSN